jgi:hypothetical protein
VQSDAGLEPGDDGTYNKCNSGWYLLYGVSGNEDEAEDIAYQPLVTSVLQE